MCFGGGSSARDARLQMMQMQAQIKANQSISPPQPMRSDEERRRGVIASITDARARTGFTDTILTGGMGDPAYGTNTAALPAPTARVVLGG